MPDITREQWLAKAAVKLTRRIEAAGFKMPEKVRYTCGFPSKSALAKKRQRIGECWDAGCSKDGTFEISVSPTQADATRVLDILLHEMIHSAVGLECGHKGNFKKCAVACGLDGKMTATTAGPELAKDLTKLAEQLGPYPHAKLEGRKSNAPKKQGTRMLKLECVDCGYVARTTKKWIETGLPTCHCGGTFTSDYQPEESDDGED
jgi:hypothetical protein